MQTQFRVIGPQSLIDAFEVELKNREFDILGDACEEPTLAIYRDKQYHKNFARKHIYHVGELYTLPKDWDTVMELIEPKVEYVKCVNSRHKNSYTEGKIYKLLEPAGETISIIADDGEKVIDIINWTTDYPNNNTFSPCTKEEFDQQELIKVGDYVVSLEDCIPYRYENEIFIVGPKSDSKTISYLYDGCNHQDRWAKHGGTSGNVSGFRKATAKEIESYNNIIVEGHKAEVKDNKIKFGCQYISKQTLLELKSLLQNRSITIGETEITEELLNKLINKL